MSSPGRVLFVEDEPPIREAFVRCFAGKPFTIDLARDLSDARELSLENSYDVVVTDMALPFGDGLDVIQTLRARQPDTSFILVTGLANLTLSPDDERAACISQIIFKPWQREELQNAVNHAMHAHRRRAAERQLELQRASNLPLGCHRILMVEDSEVDAKTIEGMLEACPIGRFETRVESRRVDAMRTLEVDDYDGVLVDLGLPDARGLTAVAMLRRYTNAPLIVVTASDDDTLSMQAIQLGAQDVLVKQKTQRTELSQRIRFAIERNHTLGEFAYLAQHHPLTGLPNRTLFYDRLTEACKRARRNRLTLGLYFIDLDGFKSVNDTYGHDVGDTVLREAANRLRSAARESDTAAHLGGDEFALIAEALSVSHDSHIVGDRIVSALGEAYAGVGHEHAISASVGVACSLGDDTATDLVRCADAAMYEAKRAGKNRLCEWPDVKVPPTRGA